MTKSLYQIRQYVSELPLHVYSVCLSGFWKEQNRLRSFLETSRQYNHWLPIFFDNAGNWYEKGRFSVFRKKKVHQGTLNKALKRIICDCNDDAMENLEMKEQEFALFNEYLQKKKQEL